MVTWIVSALRDWALIILALYVSTRVVWFSPIAVFIIGTRQHSLAVLGHDGAHRLICRSRVLNDTLSSVLCWWPLMIGLNGYKKFHFDHHRYLGTYVDPERATSHIMSDSQWRVPTNRLEWLSVIAHDLCGLGTLEMIRLIRVFPRVGVADYVGPALFAVVFASVTLVFPVFLLWYLAIFTVFRLVFRLRVYTEHVGTHDTLETKIPTWWQRFVYLPNNTWCHQEHHQDPAVPFSRLKKS